MKKDKNQLPYAQQHLANERTYLAWIRTAVAIFGIGFLVTSLHFADGMGDDPFGNTLVIVLGFCTGVCGIFIILMATFSYLRKEKQIMNNTFHSSRRQIYVTTLFLIVIIALTALYVVGLL
ncbi:MAG TPA: DUF202 domain-containing protein [Bacillales bacterium]|nr:DUF202 domain-containing protein [Bacillales bacterium]